jgi:hypothetical protein
MMEALPKRYRLPEVNVPASTNYKNNERNCKNSTKGIDSHVS